MDVNITYEVEKNETEGSVKYGVKKVICSYFQQKCETVLPCLFDKVEKMIVGKSDYECMTFPSDDSTLFYLKLGVLEGLLRNEELVLPLSPKPIEIIKYKEYATEYVKSGRDLYYKGKLVAGCTGAHVYALDFDVVEVVHECDCDGFFTSAEGKLGTGLVVNGELVAGFDYEIAEICNIDAYNRIVVLQGLYFCSLVKVEEHKLINGLYDKIMVPNMGKIIVINNNIFNKDLKLLFRDWDLVLLDIITFPEFVSFLNKKTQEYEFYEYVVPEDASRIKLTKVPKEKITEDNGEIQIEYMYEEEEYGYGGSYSIHRCKGHMKFDTSVNKFVKEDIPQSHNNDYNYKLDDINDAFDGHPDAYWNID